MRHGTVDTIARITALVLSLTLVVSITPAEATRIPAVYATYPEPIFQSVAYTGVHDEHWEAEPSGLLPPGCGKNWTQEPVYRPQWVNFSSNSWVENMIVFPCQGERFWAGVWNDVNGYHVLYHDVTNTPPLGRDNYYSIFRINEWWYYEVNGSTKGILYWNAVGNSVDVGLEVFRQEVYSQYVVHHTLRKTISEGPWLVWSNAVPSFDAGMCSIAISQDAFQEKRPFPGTGC